MWDAVQVTILIALCTAMYALGKQSSRIDALERWREEWRAEVLRNFHEIKDTIAETGRVVSAAALARQADMDQRVRDAERGPRRN